MAPACDETLSSNAKVKLRQAHRPHASIVGEWRLELNKSQVVVLVLMRSVARMLDDFFDWNVLLISLFPVQIMISCSETTETVEKFSRNLCTPNRWMLLCKLDELATLSKVGKMSIIFREMFEPQCLGFNLASLTKRVTLGKLEISRIISVTLSQLQC